MSWRRSTAKAASRSASARRWRAEPSAADGVARRPAISAASPAAMGSQSSARRPSTPWRRPHTALTSGRRAASARIPARLLLMTAVGPTGLADEQLAATHDSPSTSSMSCWASKGFSMKACAPSARAISGMSATWLTARGQQDHGDGWRRLAQLGQDFHAVVGAHDDVQEDQVGRRCADQLDGPVAGSEGGDLMAFVLEDDPGSARECAGRRRSPERACLSRPALGSAVSRARRCGTASPTYLWHTRWLAAGAAERS